MSMMQQPHGKINKVKSRGLHKVFNNKKCLSIFLEQIIENTYLQLHVIVWSQVELNKTVQTLYITY